jgi:hypothetical protein
MSENQSILSLVLKVVGLAMGVVVIVMSILDAADINTYALLLGIGLAAMGLEALQGA